MSTRTQSAVRDEALLDFVDRNNLGLPQVFEKLFFAGRTRNAVTQVTRRLIEDGYLMAYQLIANMIYFRLGPAAVKKSPSRRMSQTKPLPPSRVPIELGALFYCCNTPVIRKRLTPRELATAFPNLPKQLRFHHPYYIDRHGDKKRLAMIRVEMSGSAQFIVKKHRASLYEYRNHAGLRAMLEHDHLFLVVISPHKRLLAKLAELLENERWYPPVRLVEMSALLDFLPKGK